MPIATDQQNLSSTKKATWEAEPWLKGWLTRRRGEALVSLLEPYGSHNEAPFPVLAFRGFKTPASGFLGFRADTDYRPFINMILFRDVKDKSFRLQLSFMTS